MDLAGGQADEGRDGSPQVQQRVDLDGCLGLPEGGPREKRQAQVDGYGVECVEGMRLFHIQFLGMIQLARRTDHRVAEVLVNPEVPRLVGVGQGGSGDLAPHSEVVDLLAVGGEACLDVTQALPSRQLGERHGDELIPAGERSDVVISPIVGNVLSEFVSWQMLEQLGEDGFPRVHPESSPEWSGEKYNRYRGEGC